MIYSFRGVNLGVVGTCVGVNDRGELVRAIFPTTVNGRQLANCSVTVEPCDSTWSAGVISVRRLNHPDAEPVDFGTPVTISSSDKTKASASASESAYLALVTTTANSGTAIVDLYINVSDNV